MWADHALAATPEAKLRIEGPVAVWLCTGGDG
jgi:hypothetical protein